MKDAKISALFRQRDEWAITEFEQAHKRLCLSVAREIGRAPTFMEKLPKREAVIFMRCCCTEPVKSIAAVFGMTENQVSEIPAKLRRRLKKKTKTLTAGILAVLTAAALLTGCSYNIDTKDQNSVPHITTMNYCQHGNTLYYFGHYNGIFNTSLDTQVPLCFDPLCSHVEYNDKKKEWYSICPYNLAKHNSVAVTYTSDGEYIYMACKAENADHTDTMKRSIYRFDPMNPSDMKLVTTYSTTGTLCNAPIYTYDGMIYYVQGVYNEDFIKGGAETLDDQYMKIMRVKSTGGKSEAVLDEKFRVEYKFYMDEENYYIINYNGPLTMIDRETHEKTEVLCDGLSPSLVYSVGGAVYLICNDKTHTVTFESETPVTTSCVYRYENGICERLVGDILLPEIMDGALWYIPYEITYYGSREEFNGRETEMRDFFSKYAGELHRIDLATGEETVWVNEDPDLDLWFVGASDGIAIVCPRDVRGENEGDAPWRTPRYWKAELSEDGVIRLIGGIEEY